MENSTAPTTEITIEKKYKILGFNDDHCNCDVCGKTELKGTYAIEDLSTGEIFRAGSSCGAKMAGWTKKELMKKYKDGEKEKINNAKMEFQNSKEYINMDTAIEFMNKKRIGFCRERVEYLADFNKAKYSKMKEVLTKYNLPLNTYIG